MFKRTLGWSTFGMAGDDLQSRHLVDIRLMLLNECSETRGRCLPESGQLGSKSTKLGRDDGDHDPVLPGRLVLMALVGQAQVSEFRLGMLVLLGRSFRYLEKVRSVGSSVCVPRSRELSDVCLSPLLSHPRTLFPFSQSLPQSIVFRGVLVAACFGCLTFRWIIRAFRSAGTTCDDEQHAARDQGQLHCVRLITRAGAARRAGLPRPPPHRGHVDGGADVEAPGPPRHRARAEASAQIRGGLGGPTTHGDPVTCTDHLVR